jgi:hypothetical protein
VLAAAEHAGASGEEFMLALAVSYEIQCRFTAVVPVMVKGFNHATQSTRADKPEVRFEQIDGQHFLSKIETTDHVFTIPVSRSEILEAVAKSARGTSASGK